MSLASAARNTRFQNNGEVELSQEVDFLTDRVSLNLVAGEQYYALPDYVRSIRRVTYLGSKLDPLPERNFREVFEPGNQISTPFWYIYNNITSQTSIGLYPIPSISVPTVTDLYATGIQLGCIVEFWRISDNSTFVLPPYYRGPLLRRYVKLQEYTIEGPSQSLKQAAAYRVKWEQEKQKFKEHVRFFAINPRKMIIQQVPASYSFPARPMLPIDQFGIGVDPGE